jgi:hypothetical protein
MLDVRNRDLLAVLDLAAVLASVVSMDDLERVAFPALAGLVEADWLVYHEIDLAEPRELSPPGRGSSSHPHVWRVTRRSYPLIR